MQASTQAEDGSPGCTADLEVVAGESLSADLGAELGESRSAATAVAPAPDGAGAHADHEPAASGSAQRRTTVQEATMARRWTRATGVVCVSAVGKSTPARSAGVARPTHSDDCRVDASDRAGSGKMSRSAALADASWSGCTDGVVVRVDHRESRSVSVWQADRELSGTSAVGGVQRTAASAGTHHETRQLSVALSAGGSGASHGAQRRGMAQQVFPPGDATGTENREGSHGPQTSRSSVLDVAQGMGLRAVEKVRFARGTARNRRWCAVDHRVIDWVSRSPSRGVRSSNHDRSCDRRDAWVGLSSWPENDYERAYGWKGNTIHESEMALFSECVLQCARKGLDTADIVREACSRQLWRNSGSSRTI